MRRNFFIGRGDNGRECPLSNKSLNERHCEMAVAGFRKREREMSIPEILEGQDFQRMRYYRKRTEGSNDSYISNESC